MMESCRNWRKPRFCLPIELLSSHGNSSSQFCYDRVLAFHATTVANILREGYASYGSLAPVLDPFPMTYT